MNKTEQQYLDAAKDIIHNGEWVHNERTDVKCLTKINVDFTYNPDEFPMLTTKTTYWRAAIAEMLGYIRGYDNANDFRHLGTKTWDANANLNEAWLNNPNRKGEDDMGLVYGAIGNNWPSQIGTIDLLDKVYQDLKEHKDDRGEIWTFWNPGVFQLGCLRPCMYSHHFSVLGGKLYLNSTQRSADMPLGVPFNMIQVYFLWAVMAQITGLEMGEAYHKLVNVHFYENQVPIYIEKQMYRKPFKAPKFKINPNIKTLEDLRTWVTVEDFEVIDYEHHDTIKYPFSV